MENTAETWRKVSAIMQNRQITHPAASEDQEAWVSGTKTKKKKKKKTKGEYINETGSPGRSVSTLLGFFLGSADPGGFHERGKMRQWRT